MCIGDCDPACVNGGVCNNKQCFCPDGYTGKTCSEGGLLPIVSVEEIMNSSLPIYTMQKKFDSKIMHPQWFKMLRKITQFCEKDLLLVHKFE